MKSKLIEAHVHKRDEAELDKSLGIIRNGKDNLYPSTVENLIDASPTAGQCAWLYARFLGGGGFTVDLRHIDLSENDIYKYSPDSLLYDIAESLSKHQGAFVHINYNALYQKEDFTVLDYDTCRLGKKDDSKYNGKIVVSELGWGRDMKKDKLVAIDAYNPHPAVIAAQVEAAGGWEKYQGQILFFSLDRKLTYPKSLIERVYLFADTEYQMGLFYNSTVRRGFNDNVLVRHKAFENATDQNEFYDNLKGLMGTENGSSIMTVEDDWTSDNQEGNLKFETLTSQVKAEKYKHFEDASANYIRKAFKNIPPQLVDYVSGKLGNSSGADFLVAQALYNNSIAEDRAKVEQLFRVLFAGYKSDINPADNWEIAQYKLLDDGTIN